MKNIKNFKKVHYYSYNGELTDKEAYDIGICTDSVNGDYESLEERAYQAAYDISNDWAKETPEWKDVQEGFKRGVKEALEYVKDELENKGSKLEYNEDPCVDLLNNIISEITKLLKD